MEDPREEEEDGVEDSAFYRKETDMHYNGDNEKSTVQDGEKEEGDGRRKESKEEVDIRKQE